MKKLISIILVIIMMVTSMSAILSMPASADEPAAQEQTDWTGWTAISNASQLAGIRSGTAAAPNKYYLTADFSVGDGSGYTFPMGWQPKTAISNIVLDGNGHTLTLSEPIFNALENATVQNLNLAGSVDVHRQGWSNKSPLTANNGKDNGVVTLKNVNCSVDVKITNTTGSARLAGVIAKVKEGSYFENVKFTGTIDFTAGNQVHNFGAIVSGVYVDLSTTNRVETKFINCVNEADIAIPSNYQPHTGATSLVMGGIAGICGYSQGVVSFNGCENKGYITVAAGLGDSSSFYFVSGIVGNLDNGGKDSSGGWAKNEATVINCTNSGDINAKNCTNGLWAAYIASRVKTSTNNANTGVITVSAGGDTGRAYGHTYVADSTLKEATFHEDGYTGKAHYKCSVCGAHFANNGDKYSTTDTSIVIPAGKKSYTEIRSAADFAKITSGTVETPKKYYIGRDFKWDQNAIGYNWNNPGIIENVEIFGDGNTITISKPLFNALNNVTIDSLNIAGKLDAHRNAWCEKSPLTANCNKDSGVVTLKNINCSVAINVTNTDGSARIGGVIAKVKEGSYFENVTFDGTLTFASTATMIHHFGGIAALVYVNTDASAARQTTTFKNCVNNADIVIPEGFVTHALSDTQVSGGISGICGHAQGNLEFDGCVNNGDITINAKGQLWGTALYRNYFAAGICSYIDGVKNTAGSWILPNATIKNCTNNGDISAKSCTNGLWTNYQNGNVKTQSGNTNTGVITLTEDINTKYLYHSYQATAGVPATCTTTGTEDYYICTACGNHFLTNTDAYALTEYTVVPTLHDQLKIIDETPAQCEVEGFEAHYHCTVDGCGKYWTAEKVETTYDALVIPTLHESSFSEANLIPKREPTCALKGLEAHYYCEGCDSYLDVNKETTTKAALMIDKLEHTNFSELIEVEATCCSNGLKAHYVCEDCNQYFDAEMNPTTKAALTTTAGHTLTYVAEKACTHNKTTLKNGTKAHYVCEDCGNLFTVGGIRVSEEALTIYAIHIYFIDNCDEENSWKECSCGAKDEDSITPLQISGDLSADAVAPVETPVIDVDDDVVEDVVEEAADAGATVTAPTASLSAAPASAEDAAGADGAKADDTTTDDAKGCKSAIGATVVVMTATLALGATTLLKKKED